MKAESMKEVLNLLDLINRHKDAIDSSIHTIMKRSLNMIVYMETELPKPGKLNLFKYVATDKIRPIMECVHYQNGFCCASDGHILLKTRIGYNEKYEGKSINKRGDELEDRYPNIDGVIPSNTDGYKEYKVNFDLIDAYMKSATVWAKINRVEKAYHSMIINFHGTFFRLEYFHRLCSAMKAMGMDSIYIHEDRCRISFMERNGEAVALTPLYPHETYNSENEEIFYCEIND